MEWLHRPLKDDFSYRVAVGYSLETSRKGREWWPLRMYVAVNLLMNITTLMAVKYGSALGTFVALKAIFPVSMVLFAYIQWPLLGRTEIHWLTWASLLLLLPAVFAYQWATIEQSKRAAVHPSLASCCWPMGAAS